MPLIKNDQLIEALKNYISIIGNLIKDHFDNHHDATALLFISRDIAFSYDMTITRKTFPRKYCIYQYKEIIN